MRLQIPQRIPPCIQDISFYIHPERYEEVNDDRRSEGHKGHIDEVFPDGGRGNTHALADGGTHAEYMPFNKMFEPVHTAKLKNI